MRRRKILVAVAVLIAVGAVGVVYFTLSGASKESEEAALPSQAQPEKAKKVDREALLAELAKKRGGLPINLALKEATTPEAKAFLERDLAYQRQTRMQAADEARSRLAEVKQQLSRSTDEKKTAALTKQVEMLEGLIAKLEGKEQTSP